MFWLGAGLITPASLACLSTPLKAIYCVECLAGIALPTGGPAIRLKNKKTDEAQKAEIVRASDVIVVFFSERDAYAR